MDEIFETATLMQTGKIRNFSVITIGSAYWKQLGPFLDKTLLEFGTINEQDLQYLKMSDSPQEALDIIKASRHTPDKPLN